MGATKPKSNQPADTTTNRDIDTASPGKNKRKIIAGQNLPFSPRTRQPNVNKVFVTGTKLGLILIRAERQNNKDDAFTNNAIKLLEDENSEDASRLKIIKICSRRQSQQIDKAIMQTSAYPSIWFVSIIEETTNTAEYRREHTEAIIKFLNEIQWKYPQAFMFSGDETKLVNGTITGTWDMYLLNRDITSVLKEYVFNDFGDFLEDNEAIEAVFGPKCNKELARKIMKDEWLLA